MAHLKISIKTIMKPFLSLSLFQSPKSPNEGEVRKCVQREKMKLNQSSSSFISHSMFNMLCTCKHVFYDYEAETTTKTVGSIAAEGVQTPIFERIIFEAVQCPDWKLIV